jgi:hypothetical protein
MDEELDPIEKNDTWELVLRPNNKCDRHKVGLQE